MDECKDRDILTVTTTVGSADQAQALARELLARRLAACVQVEEGLTSFYRWEGKDCAEAEVLSRIEGADRDMVRAKVDGGDPADGLPRSAVTDHPHDVVARKDVVRRCRRCESLAWETTRTELRDVVVAAGVLPQQPSASGRSSCHPERVGRRQHSGPGWRR